MLPADVRGEYAYLKQYAADGGLANTDLMKQLEAHPDYTVAQFAQAVGAIYFGCLGLRQE